MLKQKKQLGSKGFGHFEAITFLVVLILISAIGYFVYHRDTYSQQQHRYTSLTAIVADGYVFTDKACISSQVGTSPNFLDGISAEVSVEKQVGSGSTFNPDAYYSIDGSSPLVESDWQNSSNWFTGSTSTTSFTIPAIDPNSQLSLGVENLPGSSSDFSSLSQTVSSLVTCSPDIAIQSPTTVSKLPDVPVSVTSASAVTKTVIGPSQYSTTTTTTATTATPLKTPVIHSSVSPSTTATTSTITTSKPASSTSVTSTPPALPPKPVVTPAPVPTVTLAASPNSITTGSSSNLSWVSTNATSCSASGAWSGSKSTSGSVSTGTLNGTSSYNLSCSGSGGTASVSVTVTVKAPATCSSTLPTTSTNSLYPLQDVENFSGSSLPSVWRDYGNGIQQPSGYVAASHVVLIPGVGTEIQGYPDPVSGSIGGVTGGSGAVLMLVNNSGGYDVCFSMSSGNWQNVHLVLKSWPTDNNWDEGENDFFEGNPQSMQINVHEIGSSPATNVWQGNWPASLASGVHLISARWDPVNGYRFYLDGSLVATAAPTSSIQTPTTQHFLSMQIQDMTEQSTSTETATIYWTAAYGYNP